MDDHFNNNLENVNLDVELLKEDCSENSPKCTNFKAQYFLLRMAKGRYTKLDWYTIDGKR